MEEKIAEKNEDDNGEKKWEEIETQMDRSLAAAAAHYPWPLSGGHSSTS